MINLKELMVDNWVYNSYTNQNIQVYPMMIPQLHRLEKENGSLKDCNIEPIPLTEEILLKCGFEKVEAEEDDYYDCSYEKQISSDVFVCYEEDFSCSLFWTKEDSINSYGVLPNWHITDTVHGLQNLHFILTGEELKIEL